MTEHSVTHSTFTLERSYPASPARVFAAWSDPAQKARWFVGPDDWEQSNHQLDCRVGGIESVSGGPVGGPVHSYRAQIQDIVPNQRIITTYEMHLDDKRISVSVATVEFRPESGGTRLVMTEQGAFLDGYEDAGSRQRGTADFLEMLGAYLQRETADA